MLLEKPDRQRGFKRERILRILLNHPDGELTKYRVAKEAAASEAWVREYTETLEEKGLIDDTTVVEPRALYDEWRDTRIDPNRLAVSIQQPMELLAETNLSYALTTYQAENLVQGFLFPSTTDWYVHPNDTEDWVQIIENKGMVGGGNTTIQVTDEHVFYNTAHRNGYTVVSTPQLIVDLLDAGGPAEEAAERLIQTHHNTA